MAKFAYNNAENASSGYTPSKMNYRYHPRESYKEEIDLCYKSNDIKELSIELWELMWNYRNNLFHA